MRFVKFKKMKVIRKIPNFISNFFRKKHIKYYALYMRLRDIKYFVESIQDLKKKLL